MSSFVPLLALTCAVEAAVVVALAPAKRRVEPALLSMCVNLVSFPLAWLLLASNAVGFWPAELLVVVVEAVAYRLIARVSLGRAAALSMLANGATILVALALGSYLVSRI